MIELKNVTKQLGDITAINNMSFSLTNGHILGLVGSNGAGKSTLLRLLSGIYQKDSGELLIEGEEIYDNTAKKNLIFFINDETVQWNNYTIDELKNLYQPYYPSFSEELLNQLIDITGLKRDKKMNRFSKGMKRQAILAIGLSCMTKYLFLDEAFDGIDQTMRLTVKRILIDAVIDRGLTVIISSHHLYELNEICDQVAMMHKGRILCVKETDELKHGVCKIELKLQKECKKDDFVGLALLHFEVKHQTAFLVVRGEAIELKELFTKRNYQISSIEPLSLEELFLYEMEAQGYDSKQI